MNHEINFKDPSERCPLQLHTHTHTRIHTQLVWRDRLAVMLTDGPDAFSKLEFLECSQILKLFSSNYTGIPFLKYTTDTSRTHTHTYAHISIHKLWIHLSCVMLAVQSVRKQ